MIEQNLAQVKERIENSAKRANRKPEDITLVCVTKTVGLSEIRQLASLGVTDIGENRVKDAISKHKSLNSLSAGLKWHMVGHIQTNKAAKCVKIFDIIHSLDSLRLANELERQAKAHSKRLNCFIEINAAAEAAKYGISPEDAPVFAKEVSSLQHIRIIGLMTMAPLADNREESRPYFKRLRVLRDELLKQEIPNTDIRQLSMGMTQDFETAIEEGATFVRIGTALFSG